MLLDFWKKPVEELLLRLLYDASSVDGAGADQGRGDAGTGTGSGTGTGTGTGNGSGTRAGTGTGTGSATGAETGTGTGAANGTGTGTGAGTGGGLQNTLLGLCFRALCRRASLPLWDSEMEDYWHAGCLWEILEECV